MQRDTPQVAHSLPPEELVAAMHIDLRFGLSGDEAADRLRTVGANELPRPRRARLMKRVLRQLRDPMAILLIIAASISGIALDEAVEAIAILAIVILNGVIALVQEGKAQQALEALRDYETPQSRVLRDGVTQQIPARELVRGDLILLSEGDRIPADARLLNADSMRVDESSLTGESLPVSKRLERCPPDTPVADRRNMVFSGTLVAHGSGRALVTATGSSTEFGHIASQLGEERRPTPLQGELAHLTTQLGLLAAIAALLMLFITFIEHGFSVDTLNEAFLAAVALAVAAVPEGLATVVTIALALGVLRMASQGAIVRRLPAVETLGATTVIATDKTGTLTRNELSVVDLWIPEDHEEARLVCALCNDATLDPASGDPLEVALLRWVGAAETERSRKHFEIVRKIPFDSNSKMMIVTARVSDGYQTLIKGAPESVLAVSTLPPGVMHAEIDRVVLEMAGRGAKVLALAAGKERRLESEGALQPHFVGLIALGDTVRSEARGAVHDARRAGVHLVMVTGDHVATAKAIAAEVGIRDVAAVTGEELTREGMPLDPLSVAIYARTTPEQKLDLVEALQQRGEIVAVTGDGVNDAPALLRADIGVAMGGSGTEVAKEASDLVITDDNLATIVSAIREGRAIYDNIRKVLEYLVAANISEVLVVILALILFPQLGVPLLPLQLLWINLVTDGLPAIALAMDTPSLSIMERPPRSRADSLLSAARVHRLAFRGAVLASACLGSFAIARFLFNEPLGHARATMFAALALSQLGYAFAVRASGQLTDGSRSPAGAVRRLVSNHWLIGAAVVGSLLQVLAVSWKPLVELLGTATLSVEQWVVVGVAAVLPSFLILVLEARFAWPPKAGTTGPTA